MSRVRIEGPPWYIIHAQRGEHKVCNVYCRSVDGRYYRRTGVELTNPYQWAEHVGAVGSIDPSLWMIDGDDGDKTKRGRANGG